MGYVILIIIVAILLSSVKQINQYERGVLFTLGKYSKILQPGIVLVFPIAQSYKKVDIRTKTVDVPEQEAITKDNVSIKINAVVYYKIFDASLAILEVENFYYATNQIALTTMRNIVGSVTLDELLANREKVSRELCKIVDKLTDPWGIKVELVELKEISLPETMKRVIARAAEAEREKQADITKSEGEVMAAANLAKASEVLSSSVGALHLRTLETLQDLGSSQANTIVLALPMELLSTVEKIVKRKQ